MESLGDVLMARLGNLVNHLRASELVREIKRYAVERCDDSPVQMLCGGGFELQVLNAPPELRKLWDELTRIVANVEYEAGLLHELRSFIAAKRGAVACDLRPSVRRSVYAVERELAEIQTRVAEVNARMDVVLKEIAERNGEDKPAGDQVRFWAVEVPEFRSIVRARSDEEAVDLVADHLVDHANAVLLPPDAAGVFEYMRR